MSSAMCSCIGELKGGDDGLLRWTVIVVDSECTQVLHRAFA